MCTFNKNFNTYMKGNIWGNPSFWKGKFEVTLPYEIQATLQIYSMAAFVEGLMKPPETKFVLAMAESKFGITHNYGFN